MKLSGKEFERIQAALLDAYPRRDALRKMVRIELDRNLDEFSGDGNLESAIYDLVEWADSTGRIDDLIAGARRQNPGNAALKKLGAQRAGDSIKEDESHPKKNVAIALVVISVAIILIAFSARVVDFILSSSVSPTLSKATAAAAQEQAAAAHLEAIVAIQATLAIVVDTPTPPPPKSLPAQGEGVQVSQTPQISTAITPSSQVATVSFISADYPVSVREGPGKNYAILGQLTLSQPYTITGISIGRGWLKIDYADREGWVFDQLVDVTGSLEDVPVEQTVPPQPTPVPLILTPDYSGPSERLVEATPTRGAMGGGGGQEAGTPLPSRTPTISPTPLSTATLTIPATPEVTAAAGSTKINKIDGAVYVYVPAGQFIMGSSDDVPASRDNEKPQQVISLGAFWILRTEVTNAQYAMCVLAGVCTEPGNMRWNDAAYAEHPVTRVSWYQAKEYAQWVGGRLPTEAEWEKACRGDDGRNTPWGDELPASNLANFNKNVDDTTPVGSYLRGASPYGLLDMVGNVWEWTSSKYGDYPYTPNDGREDQVRDERRVLRGGSFNSNIGNVHCAVRVDHRSLRFKDGGFRVVLSP